MLFIERPCVRSVDQGTTARLGMLGADAMAELRDLHRGPMQFGQCRNDAGHYAGLAHVAGVPADDDDCQDPSLNRSVVRLLDASSNAGGSTTTALDIA